MTFQIKMVCGLKENLEEEKIITAKKPERQKYLINLTIFHLDSKYNS